MDELVLELYDDPELRLHRFRDSFKEFHSDLKEKFTVQHPNITNKRVRFLKTDNREETLPLSIMYKGNIFELHVTAFDLYVKGYRVNNWVWISLNDTKTQKTPWFPGAWPVGFGESYADLGIDTKAKMDQLYDLESLKRGLLVMVRHSEYLSRSPKNKGKQVPGVNPDELKHAIAQIAVFVGEAARSEAVFDYIMRQKAFPPYVRFYINNWKKEQDRFRENKEGYMNDLRITQLWDKKDKDKKDTDKKDKKDTEVIKAFVKELKAKEEEEAARQFKLSKRAPKKESSSSSTPQRKPVPAVRARRLSVVYSTNSVRHFQKVFNAIGMVAELILMHSIQNHKYRLVLLIVPTVLSVMAIGSHSLFAKGVKKEHVFFLGFVGLLQGRKSCMVRQPSMKIVVEVPEQRSGGVEEPDTKQIDSSQVDKRESGGHKVVSWVPDVESVAKPPSVMIETSIADSAFSVSQCDSSISFHSAITYVPPPSTVRSVSMRDMGTEMTPIATQEPSKTGTPVRATTPIRNPGSSRPSTPGKAAPASSSVNASDLQVDASKKELSEKELQERTRREIMALGTQLGKMSIAAWASKEEDDKDASTSLKIVAVDQTPKNVIETRAAAWEEAEKAKYTARYKREELKITAWENHQKAKMEAEMRKVEGNLLGYLQVDQSTVAIKRRFPKVVEEELEKAMYAYGYEIVHTLMLDIEPEPDERVKRAMNEIGAASESSAVFIPHGPGAVRDVAAQIREGLLQASSTQ